MSERRLLRGQRQKNFAYHYVRSNGDAVSSAIKAGYGKSWSHKHARSLLSQKKIVALIETEMELLRQQTSVSEEWILQQLKIEATREDENSSHGARVSALKILAQSKGMLIDRKHITRSNPLDDMTEIELEQELKRIESRMLSMSAKPTQYLLVSEDSSDSLRGKPDSSDSSGVEATGEVKTHENLNERTTENNHHCEEIDSTSLDQASDSSQSLNDDIN